MFFCCCGGMQNTSHIYERVEWVTNEHWKVQKRLSVSIFRMTTSLLDKKFAIMIFKIFIDAYHPHLNINIDSFD